MTDDASTLEERLNSLEQMKVGKYNQTTTKLVSKLNFKFLQRQLTLTLTDNMKRDKYEKECAAALVAREKAELEKVSGKVMIRNNVGPDVASSI